MKLDRGTPSRRARVEIIPLIDCVFILLVFFIYSMLAMTLQRGIVVQLPEAAMASVVSDEDTITITITAAGMVLVDDDLVDIDAFGAAFDGILSEQPSTRVVVNADAGSEHRWFVRVIDELKRRGVTQIVILSEETTAAP